MLATSVLSKCASRKADGKQSSSDGRYRLVTQQLNCCATTASLDLNCSYAFSWYSCTPLKTIFKWFIIKFIHLKFFMVVTGIPLWSFGSIIFSCPLKWCLAMLHLKKEPKKCFGRKIVLLIMNLVRIGLLGTTSRIWYECSHCTPLNLF